MKLIIGFLCYLMVMIWLHPWNDQNKFFMWLLSWSGFYVYDTGFNDFSKRKA